MKISPSLMCMDLLKFKEQIEFIDNRYHGRPLCAESDALTVLRKPGKKTGE